MGQFLDTVGQLIVQYPSWTHFIIGAAILIQGELAIMLSVFLIVSGKLTWSEFLIFAPLSLITGETTIFLIGRMLRNTRFGWKIYINRLKPSKRFQSYFYYLKNNLTKLLVGAKFLIGVNIFVILLAGWSKTKFSVFMRSYLTGVIIWFTAVTGFAYFFMSGINFLKSGRMVKQAEYGILIVILILFSMEFFFKKLLRKNIPFQEKEAKMALEEDEVDAKDFS
ncbi:MAG: hypothetical protein WCO21_01205 [bacterium]